jgi:predicted DNA-binding transcriptional regulator YafY
MMFLIESHGSIELDELKRESIVHRRTFDRDIADLKAIFGERLHVENGFVSLEY